ncbi:MAG: cation-transporting P-type ATPase [Flavobacteriaceae bacterium]|nr:cation-transporting P-type ATPase [Flavobacteriaceae bacterium]
MIQKPFTLTTKDVIKQLNSDVKYGLNKKEVQRRLVQYGKNDIPQKGPKKRWLIFIDQFLNPIIYILAVASLFAFLFRNWAEGIAILIVIVITVTIGFFMELQAVRSLETLRKMGQALTSVLRDGKILRIKASLLVPGDIIILETGDIVSADARLIMHENLAVKEASLTGESTPIEKKTVPLPAAVQIADQNNMVFKGTLVTRGMAKAIVIATGIYTELGKIQQMGLGAKEEHTPLEKKLNQLSKWLIWLTLLLVIIVIIMGYIRGRDLSLMIQTGIALAVAAIPEGLPIVATIALAQGMLKLSKQQVIIKKLEAVHTLGATNIICTDKTGTLTEDKMKVHSLAFDTKLLQNVYHKNNDFFNSLKTQKAFDKIIMTGILCNDVILNAEKRRGDAIDLALIEFAEHIGYDPIVIQKSNLKKMEIPFDTDNKMMATVNQDKEAFNVYIKGAFESIVDYCDTIFKEGKAERFNDKDRWYNIVDDLASQGLRTLAFAYKKIDKLPKQETLLKHLTFIGIIGFMDPARKDVTSTIATYKNAGISVVMITGDHPGTAKKVAEEIGLLELDASPDKVLHGKYFPDLHELDINKTKQLLGTTVFARVTPKQKLDLIKFYQQNNNIVGMLGDGVNDVPALKKADIGIAMGIRGTEAAREAADVILKNDKFTAMELAIRQGRAIFEHIRQFVVYLLSSNLAEIISVGLAAILNLPSPLLPLQILFLNLITDIFPALALGLSKGEEDIMKLPPRKSDEPIMTRKLWSSTIIYGLSITTAVLGITIYAYFVLELSAVEINNMAFYTLIFAQLLNIFNMPRRQLSFFKNEVTTNIWVWSAIVLCVFLTISAYLIPPMAKALSLVPLSAYQLGLIIIFGFGALVLSQFIKRIGGTV